MCLCSYLYSAIFSGYLRTDDFKEYLLKFIEHTSIEIMPNWALDLSLLTDEKDILKILSEYSIEEKYNENADYSIQNVILGYYYWMYLEEKLDINIFLKKCCIINDDAYDIMYTCINQKNELDKILFVNYNKFMQEAKRQYRIILSMAYQ